MDSTLEPTKPEENHGTHPLHHTSVTPWFSENYPDATDTEIDRYMRYGELPYRGGNGRLVFWKYTDDGTRVFRLCMPDGVTPFSEALAQKR